VSVSEPTPSVVLNAMLTTLNPFVPVQIPGLPNPSLTVAKAEIRTSGVGNLPIRSLLVHGSGDFPEAAQKHWPSLEED